MIFLEVLNTADGQYLTSLEGTIFILRMKWNTRTAGWYLSVYLDDGTTIIESERIIPQEPLILFNRDLFVNGNIYALNFTDDTSLKISRDNLGKSKAYRLVYATREEIEEGVTAYELSN